MFIGREQELEALNRMYQKPGFQMFILYGRRRIGKTALLSEFMKGKKAVYYMGVESSAAANLAGLGEQVMLTYGESASGMSFQSYDGIFHYLGDQAKKERVLLILDEYPYMTSAQPGLSSLLQRVIDQNWKNENLMLILCGSSISFMEEEVLGSKSPLYGRRTGQLRLQPLPYRCTCSFCPDYSLEEQAILYGTTGGIPKYLELMEPDRTLDENLSRLFFDPDGYLYEEPDNLLKQEVQKVSLYNSIIAAVAKGATRSGEIATKAGTESASCLQALNRLIELGIIEKTKPLTGKHTRKQIHYVLRDTMFRFWYRFVPDGISSISLGYGSRYYDQIVKPNLHEYMGHIFEQMAREYIFRESMEGRIPTFFTEAGSWWGTDPATRKQEEIDVVCISEPEKTALIGECKFRNDPIGEDVYQTLVNRSHLISGYRVTDYALFSLSGFTDALLSNPPCRLITIEDMYES